MKKLITAAALTLLASAAQAEWVEELKTKDAQLFVDWSTIRVRDDGTIMWQAYANAIGDELTYKDNTGDFKYRSMIVQYHTKCITKANKIIGWHKEWAKTYSQPDLKELRASLDKHAPHHEFRTQTGFFSLNMKVCNYR